MNLLVTGASGFLGPTLVNALATGGHHGTATSRRSVAALPPGWRWQERSDVLARRHPAPDAVIHLEVKQHDYSANPETLEEFEAINIGGTREWLDWCDRCGVERFVYFSSIKAVGATPGLVADELTVGPNGAPYGASKWRAEELVRAWATKDPKRSALILRPAVIYGRGSTANIAAMVSAIKRGRFMLVGRNENVKSVVSLKNVTEASRYLVERMQDGRCDIFCITDPENYSVRELDALIRARFGKRGNSLSVPHNVAKGIALIGDLFGRAFGCAFPLNSLRLAALLEETNISCAKLKAAGFVHPQSTEEGIAQME